MRVEWYCQDCQRFVTTEPKEVHELHKERVVGIREDVLRDSMRRVISDLRITDRLVPYKT